MADPFVRAERLIALALDPAASPEESRTAAVQACRTIREHGLLRPTSKISDWYHGPSGHPADTPASTGFRVAYYSEDGQGSYVIKDAYPHVVHARDLTNPWRTDCGARLDDVRPRVLPIDVFRTLVRASRATWCGPCGFDHLNVTQSTSRKRRKKEKTA